MRIYSIFSSMNGEVNNLGIGSICTFIRFAGCTAECVYCDTQYAKNPHSGKEMSVEDILTELSTKHFSNNITITGGEPFEQREDLGALLLALGSRGYNVTVETNGLHDFHALGFGNINWVVDIKAVDLFSIQRYIRMRLRPTDYLKIVISDELQFMKTLTMKQWLRGNDIRARFAVSPEYGKITADDLLKWAIENKEDDLFINFQAHKLLNLTEPK